MNVVRLNELARHLEIKPSKIIEMLPALGVLEKKTHSSAIRPEVALQICKYLGMPMIALENCVFGRTQVNRTPSAGLHAPTAAAPVASVAVQKTELNGSSAGVLSIIPEQPVEEFEEELEEERAILRSDIATIASASEYALEEYHQLPSDPPKEWLYAVKAYGVVVLYGLLHRLFEGIGVSQRFEKPDPMERGDRLFGQHIHALVKIVNPQDPWVSRKEFEETFKAVSFCRNKISHPEEAKKPKIEEVRRTYELLDRVVVGAASSALNWAVSTPPEEAGDVPVSCARFIWHNFEEFGRRR